MTVLNVLVTRGLLIPGFEYPLPLSFVKSKLSADIPLGFDEKIKYKDKTVQWSLVIRDFDIRKIFSGH